MTGGLFVSILSFKILAHALQTLCLFTLVTDERDVGDLAALIGVHASHVSRYERNLTSPTIEVAKKIADALEVSTDSLVYGSNEQIINNKLNDEELLQLFHKVQQLDKENLTSVKAMLKAFVFQKDLLKQLA